MRYDAEFGIVHVAAKDQVLDLAKIADEEFYAKRIGTRILKERRNKRPKFSSDKFKKEFIATTNNDEEINDFFKRANSMVENPLMQSQEFSTSSAFGQPRSKVVEQANQQHQQEKMSHNQMLQESVN